MQFFAPQLRDGGWTFCLSIPEQLQRELFEVVEIDRASVPLGDRKLLAELLREPQQRGHLWTDPVPVLGQRIGFPFHPGQRVQEPGIVEQLFHRLPMRSFLLVRPMFLVVTFKERGQGRGDLFPRRVGRRLA